MKTSHTTLVSALFLSVLAASPLFAQNTFDAKKKATASVNTSSLNAGRMTPVALKGTVRSSGSRSMGHQARSFQQPLLKQRLPKIIYSAETGLPSFIKSERNTNAIRLGSSNDMHTACADYLLELKSVLGIKRPDVDFSIRSIAPDRSNTQVRLDQRYKGIPVYGADVVVHLNASGEGESFNGIYYDIMDNIDVVPALSEQAALEKVNSQLARKTPLRPLNEIERKLVQFERPQVTLCIYRDKSLVTSFLLAYHIVSCPSIQQRWEHFVDAVTGKVLRQYETTCFVDGPQTANALDLNGVSQSINTYKVGSNFFLLDASRTMFNAAASALPDTPVGGILTIDVNNTFGANTSFKHVTTTTNVWNNSTAVSAHFNAGVAYEYFKTKFSRNGIDNIGGTIYSMINVPNETGQPLDNAFWNGKFMSYGNGNVAFKPLAGSLDVGGHEMTHGVVQNTANLEYLGESGAINESMADIFGSMMDPADWLIGEDVVKLSAFPSGALRSLSDPHNGGTSLGDPGYQPKHTSEMYTGTEDNGGVHINSGIPNNAFFRLAEATTRDKAASIFYRALNNYLTKSSKFIDLRLAVIKAAGDLFGAASNEVTQAGIAFDAVGISSGTGGNFNETLTANPGEEFLLINNTDTNDPNTLYRSPGDASAFVALSTTPFVSRPSITDDGTIAVFVGGDNKIHAIHTAPGSAPDEVIVQNDAIWSNVVVSKGGTKLAAVTVAQDTSIYVYDFESQIWKRFMLYNPTFSQGVNSGGPIYADALEWDYPGEALVYDCFNRVQNSTGVDIEYWDVNFIRVWDKGTNDFSDGTIAKLFASLPEDVSIGNPSFSKNSPNIIAFDYVNSLTNEYAVLGSNIETSDVNVIAPITSLGYPTFNKNDSRVAFTSLNGAQHNIDYVVLNSDKISASGTPLGLISDAKWPVYFATGQRETGDCIAPTPTISSNGNPLPTLTSSAATGNQWFLNGTPISGATGTTLNATESGTYTVQTAVNSCHSAFSADFQLVVTGDISQPASLFLYPNPTHDYVFITGVRDQATESAAFDMIGGSLSIKLERHNEILRGDISHLTNGMYVLKIVNDGMVHQIKFVKN